jgi:hypothetical protein
MLPISRLPRWSATSSVPWLEQRAAVVQFERVVLGQRLGEALHHARADVLVREHRREAQHRLVLRRRRPGEGPGRDQRRARRHHHPSREPCGHVFLPFVPVAAPAAFRLEQAIAGKMHFNR